LAYFIVANVPISHALQIHDLTNKTLCNAEQ